MYSSYGFINHLLLSLSCANLDSFFFGLADCGLAVALPEGRSLTIPVNTELSKVLEGVGVGARAGFGSGAEVVVDFVSITVGPGEMGVDIFLTLATD